MLRINRLSKYDNVFARTVAENENDGRSLLHVSYPVTEHEAINARMQQLAHDFIDEYRATAAEIETAFQEHRTKRGRSHQRLSPTSISTLTFRSPTPMSFISS